MRRARAFLAVEEVPHERVHEPRALRECVRLPVVVERVTAELVAVVTRAVRGRSPPEDVEEAHDRGDAADAEEPVRESLVASAALIRGVGHLRRYVVVV